MNRFKFKYGKWVLEDGYSSGIRKDKYGYLWKRAYLPAEMRADIFTLQKQGYLIFKK